MTLQIERDLKYSIDRPLNRCVTPKYLSIVKEKATAAITKKNTLYSFRNCLIYWSIMLDLQYARVHWYILLSFPVCYPMPFQWTHITNQYFNTKLVSHHRPPFIVADMTSQWWNIQRLMPIWSSGCWESTLNANTLWNHGQLRHHSLTGRETVYKGQPLNVTLDDVNVNGIDLLFNKFFSIVNTTHTSTEVLLEKCRLTVDICISKCKPKIYMF